MNRREFLGTAGALAVTAASGGWRPARAASKVIIAEPVHGTGYLPLYVAIQKGYFSEAGIEAETLTTEGGGAHTNAVLTGQAFAFIGGPEHNAFAKAKGAELRAMVNCVDRGNTYYCAAPGKEPTDTDWASYFKGKTIAVSQYGGTPNSITRYLLKTWELDAKSDVTLLETANAGIAAAVSAGQADIGVTSEPMLTQGIRQGIWGEPFFNVPKELGPYAYSTFNIRKQSIDEEPEVVEAFVRGMMLGLKFTHENHEGAAEIAAKEFPTMAPEDLKATLDRSFADDLWSPDGWISPESWATGSKVVRTADILKSDVAYEEIIDMSFFKKLSNT